MCADRILQRILIAMNVVDIDTLRHYCRTEEDEDAFLETLADSAEAELAAQGVCLNNCSNLPMLQRAVCALVLHWHDNPAGGEIPPALDKLIINLRQQKVRGVV